MAKDTSTTLFSVVAPLKLQFASRALLKRRSFRPQVLSPACLGRGVGARDLGLVISALPPPHAPFRSVRFAALWSAARAATSSTLLRAGGCDPRGSELEWGRWGRWGSWVSSWGLMIWGVFRV
ncbi:hypothetical protein NL676_037591 [Syzygium grande]|nr:hypothetical protein NL676_037591 [Syzygium grande]